MAQMIVKLSAGGERVDWWHPLAGAGSGPLESAPRPGAARLVVLAPAEDVLIAEARLPGNNRSRQLQALPYALEENLADDLGHYHFALGQALGENRYVAAAVGRELLGQWLERLGRCGLEPLVLLPEAMALPAPADESGGVVAIDGDRALVRIGGSKAYAVDRSELACFLALEADLQTLTLYGEADFSLPGVRVAAEPARALLELLADGARRPPVNLLQGTFQPASQRTARALRVWKTAAAAALLAALLAILQQGLAYRQQAQRVAALQARAETLLKQAFPEISRVVNPRVQMEQGLAALRAARGDLGQAGFLYLLRLAGPTLAESGDVSVESLSYRGDGLVLEVRARDLAGIEEVRQKIHDRSGIAVVLESAATLADGADGRLRLEGGPG